MEGDYNSAEFNNSEWNGSDINVKTWRLYQVLVNLKDIFMFSKN